MPFIVQIIPDRRSQNNLYLNNLYVYSRFSILELSTNGNIVENLKVFLNFYAGYKLFAGC